uniref:Uncharacterized protein n=1 Tax=viral metagenome TaxID=1070528 RepID=A0A6M3KJZ3_9ZZZZ
MKSEELINFKAINEFYGLSSRGIRAETYRKNRVHGRRIEFLIKLINVWQEEESFRLETEMQNNCKHFIPEHGICWMYPVAPCFGCREFENIE